MNFNYLKNSKNFSKISFIKISFSLLFIISASGKINAANDNYPLGSRAAAMSNISVMLSDVWSVFHNQAGLAGLEHIVIGFHHENKFIVPQYGLQALAIGIPVRPGTIGVTYSFFGYSRYNESKLGLAFGKSLGESFSAGIQLNYLNTYIDEEYGNQGTLAIEGGILSQPVKNLFIGFHIFNPTKSKLSAYDIERIPTIFRFGAGYNFSDKFFIGTEIEKDLDKEPVFKTGGEYKLLDNLFLRSGISTNPNQYTFGLGFVINRFMADIAFTRHKILGFTPHFSIVYKFL